jgi:putrescine transport system substrate-binding protein
MRLALPVFASLVAVSLLCSCVSTPPPLESAAPIPAAIAAPAPAFDTDPEKLVVFYNWPDYIDPAMVRSFTAETGIQVVEQAMESNPVLDEKLRAGGSGFDVVMPSGIFLATQIQEGRYRKLDKAKLTNLRNLDASLVAKIDVFDPGHEYAVNYAWGTTGMAYNMQAIRALMPEAPVHSYAMLWNPAVVKRFAKCGVAIFDEPAEIVSSVLFYLGKDPNSEKPEDIAAVEKVLKSIRPHVRLLESAKVTEALAAGEICLALTWSSDSMQASARAQEAGKAFDIVYSIAKEGAIAFFDNLAIPADAKHVKNAHLFINHLLRADVAARNTNYTSFASSNGAALLLVVDAVRNDPGIHPEPELMAKIVVDRPDSSEFAQTLARVWARFRDAK